MMINVTIFNEFRHKQENTAVQAIYPDGTHAVLAAALGAEADITARTAT